MAENGEALRAVGGINSGLQRRTICGGELESLGHVSNWRSQMAKATTMTTARAADMISSQRVCMADEGRLGRSDNERQIWQT